MSYSQLLSQAQEAIYSLLCTLQTELLNVLKDGAVSKDAYQFAVSYIRDKKPHLERHFIKNIGHGVSTFGL